MSHGSDWRVRFHADGSVVYDALLGKRRTGTWFELSSGGMRFAGVSGPHPVPPDRFWVMLCGTISLDETVAARYGLDQAATAAADNGG